MIEQIYLMALGVVVSSVTTYMITKTSKVVKDKENRDKQIVEGLKSLTRIQINSACYKANSVGEIGVNELQDIEDLYKSYKTLGGNGRTEKIVQETRKLPVNISKGVTVK